MKDPNNVFLDESTGTEFKKSYKSKSSRRTKWIERKNVIVDHGFDLNIKIIDKTKSKKPNKRKMVPNLYTAEDNWEQLNRQANGEALHHMQYIQPYYVGKGRK